MKESLYKYKVLLQKFNEKTSQLQLIQDKSTQLHRKKKFLQRQINIFLSDIDEVSKQRAVSAPKKRENLDLSSMNKTQNDYLLTDRSIINQTNKNRQKNEKSILHDMTIKKHDLNLGDCSIKNQSKYNNCNNNKECPRHQKAYKFNLEEASTKEIELFDNVKKKIKNIMV